MFTLTDAMRMADKATFERGNRYFKTGHVTDVNIVDAADDEVLARVRGTERKPYVVQLSREGGVAVAQCSCPVGFNCKHAVAVILQLVHDRQTQQAAAPARTAKRTATQMSPARQLERWLHELEHDPAARQEGPVQPGHHYLLYALAVQRTGVLVSFYKGYLKQDLTWGKLARHSVDFFSLQYNRAAHIREEDIPVLNLLSTLRTAGDIRLRSEEGALALTRMLATGRLLLENPLRPARSAAPLPLELGWEETDSQQQIRLLLQGHSNWELIPVEPPFYMHGTTGDIGPLVTPLGTGQIKTLHSMPPVPNADMTSVALRLRQHFSPEQLPLPQEPDIRAIATFIPHLTLVSVPIGGGVRLPGVRLQLDYDPLVLDPVYFELPPEQQLIEQDGQCYRVRRDLAEEMAVQVMLQGERFELFHEAGPLTDIWMPDGNTPTDAMNRWLRWQTEILPGWQAKGWRISNDSTDKLKIQQVHLEVQLSDAQKGWFEFELALYNGQWRLSTQQVVTHWLHSGGDDTLLLPTEKGEWLKVDLAPLHSIKGFIEELHNQKKLDNPARLPAFNALALDDISAVNSQRAPLTRKLMQELRNFTGLEAVAAPKSLNAQLRQYQQQGLNWLAFLQRFRLGGILADDMGLGKTLQTLALILHMQHSGNLKKPALVICPTSLAGNWRREAEQFAPSLRVLVIHGSQRNDLFKQAKHHDLVITTYPLLVRDYAHYQKQNFALVVADEAQTIKNINTKAAQAIRSLNTPTRLCLTGTPLENHLGELWALMDFVLPDLLGSQESFRKLFRQPIENDNDAQRRAELARRVAPFMIRRTKSGVVQELPPKTEMIQYVELEGGQRQLYESIRVSMEQRIRDLVKKKGMARSQIEFLDALLKLRQVCIDPRLVKLASAKAVKEQAKLDWLRENLPQMVEEGRKVLVFSQFTEALALVEELVQAASLSYTKLTGKTRKRDEAISDFQNGDAAVFLISLKAGGSGLNLTAADVVIHVDPWWNPAVENQATDRAYRIGQDKPVFVYKLVAADTIEERIQQLQKHKQALAEALFDDTGTVGMPSNADELLALLG